jgi:hypothetical protein
VRELHIANARTASGAHNPANLADILSAKAKAKATCEALRSASDTERDFIFYRLLLAAPWSETQAHPNSPLARELGRLFDATIVPIRLLRHLANTWTRRAWIAGRSIVSTWARGVQQVWTAAGGSDEEGAAFVQDPLPLNLSLSFAAFVRREQDWEARQKAQRMTLLDYRKIRDIDASDTDDEAAMSDIDSV